MHMRLTTTRTQSHAMHSRNSKDSSERPFYVSRSSSDVLPWNRRPTAVCDGACRCFGRCCVGDLPSLFALLRANALALQALASADVLLIAAGAGFSADSGLPVYDSIAADPSYAAMGITYSDLCSPLLMAEKPELFYGFWGTCSNLYRAAPLHAGYALLNRWAEQAQQRRQTEADVQPCWVYTSNVDGRQFALALLFARIS